jgi:hypothetical protein
MRNPLPPQSLACELPDGTPHPDQGLAAKGWKAIGGVYRREPATTVAHPWAVCLSCGAGLDGAPVIFWCPAGHGEFHGSVLRSGGQP